MLDKYFIEIISHGISLSRFELLHFLVSFDWYSITSVFIGIKQC